MNAGRHFASHAEYYQQRCRGEDAARHACFYDDYNATLDLPEAFYLDTVRTVFQECRLARGDWVVDGEAVRPQDIEGMALLSIEGERDDITAPGQTAAALDLCSGIAPEYKRSLVAPGCGHYGTFAGRHWQDSICPAIGASIAQAEHRFSHPIRTHAATL